jgi:hypothetical protein
MIRVRAMMIDGITTEGSYDNIQELSEYIEKYSVNIKTLEVDIESSDNNRPAFWCEE